MLQIVEHPDNPDYWVIQIPTGLNRGGNSYDASAVSLYNTSISTLVSAYDVGKNNNVPTLNNGVAAGSSTVNTINVATGKSGHFDHRGNETEANISSGSSVLYFANGTLITLADGCNRPVEDLRAGDVVRTSTGEAKPIWWVGSSKVSPEKLVAHPNLRPIRVPKGALGPGLPTRDLRLSRQHKMLVSSPVAQRMFGVRDVLVAAIRLVGINGIEIDNTISGVSFFHILLQTHDLVYAEGALAETLFIGPHAVNALSEEAKSELETLFPEKPWENMCVKNSGLVPENKLQKKLVSRIAKNGRCLFEPVEQAG